MVTSLRLPLLLLLVISFSSCTFGWLYNDTVEPLCINMDATQTKGTSAISSLKEIAIPRIPGARAMWSSNAIGDVAKQNGIQRLHYCDRKRFRVLGGLWGKDSIVLYGE
ncbi:hypothetical protein OAO01_01065 [Oligoflexia bacterium]|nr:hypothetical protein [Oligoflexia bacterium]